MNQQLPTVKLSELAEIFSGFAFKSKDLQNQGIPLIKIKNVNHKVVSKDCEQFFPSDLVTNRLNKYFLQEKDVLVAMTGQGSLGRIGRMQSKRDKYLVNQRVGIVRAHDLSNADYLFSVLALDTYEEQLFTIGLGAGQPNVSAQDIGNLEIPWPSTAQRKFIGNVRCTYDELIENNNRRITLLEEIAQNLYREWFINFCFPNHEHTQWQETPQGKIPANWERVELGDLITIRRGKTITKKTAIPEDVPVIAGGLQPAYFHNVANTQAPVITVSASGANAGYVNMYTLPVWASDCSYIDIETTPYVYYYYLLMKNRQVEITRMQTGAAQPHVYPKDLMRLEVLNIPTELLDNFTEKVTPIFQLIANLTAKNDNLKQQRDTLLPRLFLSPNAAHNA